MGYDIIKKGNKYKYSNVIGRGNDLWFKGNATKREKADWYNKGSYYGSAWKTKNKNTARYNYVNGQKHGIMITNNSKKVAYIPLKTKAKKKFYPVKNKSSGWITKNNYCIKCNKITSHGIKKNNNKKISICNNCNLKTNWNYDSKLKNWKLAKI